MSDKQKYIRKKINSYYGKPSDEEYSMQEIKTYIHTMSLFKKICCCCCKEESESNSGSVSTCWCVAIFLKIFPCLRSRQTVTMSA